MMIVMDMQDGRAITEPGIAAVAGDGEYVGFREAPMLQVCAAYTEQARRQTCPPSLIGMDVEAFIAAIA
jgi:hypothetical protein